MVMIHGIQVRRLSENWNFGSETRFEFKGEVAIMEGKREE